MCLRICVCAYVCVVCVCVRMCVCVWKRCVLMQTDTTPQLPPPTPPTAHGVPPYTVAHVHCELVLAFVLCLCAEKCVEADHTLRLLPLPVRLREYEHAGSCAT